VKIGQFSKKFKISIDTIRHYIDLGLIVPIKNGRTYIFNEQCEKDLLLTIKLKNWGFRLKDIKQYLHIQRIGSASKMDDITYLVNQLNTRVSELDKEIAILSQQRVAVLSEIDYLQDMVFTTNQNKGIPFDILNVIKCKKCLSVFKIIPSYERYNNEIVKGDLECSCGNVLKIENGMVIGKNYFKNRYVPFQVNSDNFYKDYVMSTNPIFLDQIYKSIEWISTILHDTNCMSHKRHDSKTIMELGVGSGLFLKKYYNKIGKDDIYIAVDHDIKRIKLVKDLIDKKNSGKRTLFVVSDFEEIPIAYESIDIIIDFYSSASYSIESKKPLVSIAKDYLSKDGLYIGVYATYKQLKSFGIEAVTDKNAFILHHVKKRIEEAGLRIIDDNLSEPIAYSKKYDTFHQSGKGLQNYMVMAQK
jgi:DNA-binding transcriptional MerR regulator